jgi:hypothetical protein
MKLVQASMLFSGALLAAFCGPSHAQPQEKCAAYHSAVAGDGTGFIPVIPDRLLVDWKGATPCLTDVLRKLSPTIKSPTLSGTTRNQFLSATGALRSIATRLAKEDEKQDEIRDRKCAELQPAERAKTESCQKQLDIFIRTFRLNDDIDVISALTYGARSDNPDARLNSLLILGDVIDNSTVCVPLTHLADPKIGDGDHGVTARANLLSVISVVAPWAYKENFQNIQRTRELHAKSIAQDDKSLTQTVAILRNIESRSAFNKPDNNQKYSLPKDWRDNCRKYAEVYQPALTKRDTVEY